MVKRKQKKYSRPRRPFDKVRIDEENILKEKYGLKNKKEIWKAEAAIGRIRNQAKKLITKSDEEKEAFVKRLQKKGFQVENIADTLALNNENLFKRRLQTMVFEKGLCNTPKQARQLVVHKHITIDGNVVNIPSYAVALEEEATIELKIVLKTPKKQEKKKEEDIENLEEIIEEEKAKEEKAVKEDKATKNEEAKEEKATKNEEAKEEEPVKEEPVKEEPVKEDKLEEKIK
jgi:small subunit ribosomal protein S4